ncbi:MAG TPA: hypothetical protein VFX38_06425 [Gammaproteobacteria bacterium]|nr:hypothetical protein [Gammaproteobacteria bacterium]
MGRQDRSNTGSRSRLSIFVLLALVLAVTTQLVTGFALWSRPGGALLLAHVIGGAAAIALTLAEWLWLAATRPGRKRLAGFVAAASGPSEWSEAMFLVVTTATVVLGALLAAALYLGARLPFANLFAAHRALAIAVAALYILHSLIAIATRPRQR